LTGRNSWQLEEAANHWPAFPAKFKTYAEVLGEDGYHVGFTGKGWAPGHAGQIDGKNRQLCGPGYHQQKTTPPASGISSTDYAANFEDFLGDRGAGEPFCFWYGGYEPHRRYEYKSGISKGGKKLEEIDKVFDFWPDNETVRTDMLDYAFEIEYFDKHLAKMLEKLEELGELDNTLVIVTADNGMPFPRIKGQEYEYSNHLPLAAMWPKEIKSPGRVVDDFVSFIDFAPTFLETAGIKESGSSMQKIQGKGLAKIFHSSKSGIVDASRDHVLIGKERHDVGRPNDWGYPIRGIVKDNLLYILNFETERWPSGNPETGYLNCDGSPTKTECIVARKKVGMEKYWQMSFGKRQAEELYDIEKDPECINNLAPKKEYEAKKQKLQKQLFAELKAQGDPRMFGKGRIFDDYEYVDQNSKGFYDRYMGGEKLNAGWVNKSDFEKEPIE
jgi:arylsulfatase A-like enzyme